MKKHLFNLFILILAGFLFVGCRESSLSEPASTATATVTPPPIPTGTDTLTPTATFTQTPTPTLSAGDIFLDSSRQWKVAFVDPDSQQVCIMAGDGSGKVCSDYVDYDYPGGFRRKLGSWSPDGSKFALDRNDDTGIYIWNMVEDMVPFKKSGDGLIYRQPVWSSDGNLIAYQVGTVSYWDVPADTVGIYMESLDHTHKSHISSRYSSADWSPDGQKILFSEVVRSSSNANIYVTGSGGTDPRLLGGDSSGGSQPIWSPDGLHIAFLQRAEANILRLCVMDADGSNLRTLAEVAYANPYARYNYSWLPNGEQILYSDQLIDVASGTVTRLHFPFDPSSAVWFMRSEVKNP